MLYKVFTATKQHVCYQYYVLNLHSQGKQGELAYLDYHILAVVYLFNFYSS